MNIETAMENIVYGEKHKAANGEPSNLLTYLESKGFCEAYDSQQKKIDVLLKACQMISRCHQHDVQSCPCKIFATQAVALVEGKDS